MGTVQWEEITNGVPALQAAGRRTESLSRYEIDGVGRMARRACRERRRREGQPGSVEEASSVHVDSMPGGDLRARELRQDLKHSPLLVCPAVEDAGSRFREAFQEGSAT